MELKAFKFVLFFLAQFKKNKQNNKLIIYTFMDIQLQGILYSWS